MPSITPSMTAAQIAALREGQRRYRLENKEKIAAWGKAWAQANKAKRVAAAIAWQKRNPEKLRAIRQRFRQQNREKIRAYQRVWHAARRKKKLEEKENIISARIEALASKPLSPAEQLSLYNALKNALPNRLRGDLRAEAASVAYIAIYEGQLPLKPSAVELARCIARYLRQAFPRNEVVLSTPVAEDYSLGQKLGIY